MSGFLLLVFNRYILYLSNIYIFLKEEYVLPVCIEFRSKYRNSISHLRYCLIYFKTLLTKFLTPMTFGKYTHLPKEYSDKLYNRNAIFFLTLIRLNHEKKFLMVDCPTTIYGIP